MDKENIPEFEGTINLLVAEARAEMQQRLIVLNEINKYLQGVHVLTIPYGLELHFRP